jgi:hypothetical protein
MVLEINGQKFQLDSMAGETLLSTSPTGKMQELPKAIPLTEDNFKIISEAMEIADNFRWKNPQKDGFPRIGTVCAIRKHGETMIGRLVDTEEWDDWEVNGEYEDCVEEYFILPQKND